MAAATAHEYLNRLEVAALVLPKSHIDGDGSLTVPESFRLVFSVSTDMARPGDFGMQKLTTVFNGAYKGDDHRT